MQEYWEYLGQFEKEGGGPGGEGGEGKCNKRYGI